MGATMRIKRNDGRKMPTVATREPQNPATIAPTNVAVMTTGPGLIMPIATATRNCRSSSQPVCCTSPFSRKGTMTKPLPKVRDPALRKKARSLPRIELEALWETPTLSGTAARRGKAGA